MWNVIACVLISALILGKACPQLATEGTACSSYSYECGSCSIWEKRAHKTVKSNKGSLKCLRSLGRFTEEPKGLSWSRIEPYGSVPRQIKSAGAALCECVCVLRVCCAVGPSSPFYIKDEWSLFSEGPLPENRLVFLMSAEWHKQG